MGGIKYLITFLPKVIDTDLNFVTKIVTNSLSSLSILCVLCTRCI